MKQNKHHPIHNRVEWSSRPESRYIRENPSILFPMEVPLHAELHRECPEVPLLGVNALQEIVRIWVPDYSNKLRSLGLLQLAIERASHNKHSHKVQSALAELVLYSIDLQIPYLTESIDLSDLH